MRLRLLVAQLAVGGTERQFVALAGGLADRGHDVELWPLFGGGAFAMEARVPVRPLRDRRPRLATLFLRDATRRLAQRVTEERPDVLYAGDYATNLVSARAVSGRSTTEAPAVVWSVRHQGTDLPWSLRFARWAARGLEQHVALAIANAKSAESFHRELGYLPAATVVIPNGVDLERFRPRAEHAGLRGRLGLAPDALLVGHLGRFAPFKDHVTFLDAAARVAAERAEVHFVVAAPRVDAPPEVVQRALRSPALAGRCHLVAAGGGADAIAPEDLLPEVDAFVSSSRAEGFPNVVVEAMACGVPCVVTDAGDAREAVGDTGGVVPVGDPAALASAVLALLAADDRVERGASARRRVEERFGFERLFDRTEHALRGVLPAAAVTPAEVSP